MNEVSLTPRERDVLLLVATGASNGRIAQRLGLSEQTVKNHLASSMQRLKATNRIQAVLRSGLLCCATCGAPVTERVVERAMAQHGQGDATD